METTIIKLIGVLLAVVSPAALLYVLKKGIDAMTWDHSRKRSYWNKLVSGVMVWTILMFALVLEGVFEYQAGDIFPRFMIGLLVPVTFMMILFMQQSFRSILNSIPLHVLAGSQFFRVFGAVFFLIAISGAGPMDFISSGYGDVLTGLLAIVAAFMAYKNFTGAKVALWSFSIVGMLDLANVSYILLLKYPIWSEAVPSTALAGSFPMMLVLSITAPVALLLHIYAIRALLKPAHTYKKIAIS